MIKKLLFLIFTLACVANYAYAEERTSGKYTLDKMAVFSFVIGDDVFMLPYRNNNRSFREAVDFITTYQSLIDDGTVAIYVNGYCGKGGTLKTRTGRVKRMSNYVKGELIRRKKASEVSFLTSNTTESFADTLPNAVVLRFYLPFQYLVNQSSMIVPPNNVPDLMSANSKRIELVVADITCSDRPLPLVSVAGIWGVDTKTSAAPRKRAWSPSVGVKTNLLYGALTFTPNLGLEVAVGRKSTIEVGYGYNWFNVEGSPENNKKLVHYLATAEYRHWLKEKFDGHFFGAHLLGGEYNISQYELPLLFGCHSKEYRYYGWVAGAGVSYGYQWVLARRWRIEATIGLGYAYLQYDRYGCANCGTQLSSSESRHYVGPTKLGVSFMYVF